MSEQPRHSHAEQNAPAQIASGRTDFRAANRSRAREIRDAVDFLFPRSLGRDESRSEGGEEYEEAGRALTRLCTQTRVCGINISAGFRRGSIVRY